MSTLDYYRRKRFINTICSDVQLSYVEDSSVTCPHTDGRTVYMPIFDPQWSDQQKDCWMSSLLHECYHSKGDNIKDIELLYEKQIGNQSLLGQAMNVVVDHNIERNNYGIYDGADRLMRDSYHGIFSGGLEKLKEYPPKLQAIMALDIKSRSTWLLESDYNIRDRITDEAKDHLSKIEHLGGEYRSIRPGGQPNYDFTVKLLEEMGENEDDLREEAKQAAQQEGSGDEEADGQNGKGKGKDKGKGDGEKSKGSGDATVVYPDDLSLHKHTTNPNQNLTYTDMDFTKENPSSYELCGVKEVELTGSPERGVVRQIQDRLTTTLSTKVRNLLKVYSQAKHQGGKKRGKIHKKAIATITNGNDRIFRQKEVKDVLDTCVGILVDGSGSMSGSRIYNASAAAIMMNDCLNKLNMPSSIVCFSTGGSMVRHYVHTEFNDRTPIDELTQRMANFIDNGHMSQNLDGESLLWMADKLAKQKQKRKILIILSDGQPAGKSHIGGFTMKVAKDIEKSGVIELYSIGIETDCVEHIYANSVCIDRSTDLEEALFGILKSALIK